jgi:hypothetical protein
MQMSDVLARRDLTEYSGTQPIRRTFARVAAFDVACPRCGTIDCVSSARPWWKRKTNFDPWRSRWRCRVCRRVFAVGVVLWPVSRAGNRPRESRPLDTIPTKQELLGLLQAADRGWSDPVNLICTCASEDRRHAPDCPLANELL